MDYKSLTSWFLLLTSFIFSCSEKANDRSIPEDKIMSTDTILTNQEFNFLALGDSYTIGESVDEMERWPVQLTTRLKRQSINAADLKIIATTGWTTGNLLNGIENANIADSTFSLVSLLIGVNNQYQGKDINIYKSELPQLLDVAIQFAGGNNANVIVLSIPDYGVTPFAKNRNPEKIGTEIDIYNQIKKEECEKRGIKYYDITEISRRALTDETLLARDKLHPSGKMYSLWVDVIYNDVMTILSSP